MYPRDRISECCSPIVGTLACSKVRLEKETFPSSIRELQRQVEDTVRLKKDSIENQDFEKAVELRDQEEQDRARQKLNQVLELCTLQTCRRKFLMEYLGEEWPEENCGGCDVCVRPREEYDATEIA